MATNVLALHENQAANLIVGAVESINLTTIFSLFLEKTLHQFLLQVGHFVLFPVAALCSAIESVLAWRQVMLEEENQATLLRAFVQTLASIAIVTAVIGGFIAAAAFATIGPIIFTATMAFKTAFNLGAALYYGYLAQITEGDVHQKNRAATIGSSIATVAGLLATVSVGFVMLAGKPLFAVLGVLSGIIGAIYTGYHLATLHMEDGSMSLDNKSTVSEALAEETNLLNMTAEAPKIEVEMQINSFQSGVASKVKTAQLLSGLGMFGIKDNPVGVEPSLNISPGL